MMQAASLPVHRDGVVRCIGHAVGLVVADDEPVFASQQRHEKVGEARIAIVEHAGMPGPRHAFEGGREAVHRDQGRWLAGMAPEVEFGFDTIVVGPKNLAHARGLLPFAETNVTRYRRQFADVCNRGLRARRAITVDDETRIILLNQSGIECVRHNAADRGDTDVPGNVAFAIARRNSELSQRARHQIARVVNDEQEWRPAIFVAHRDRRGLIGRQQFIQHLVHRRSGSWKNNGMVTLRAVLGVENACI